MAELTDFQCFETVATVLSPRTVQKNVRASVARMASGAAHRAGTGSSHANPIAILSSPSAASDVEDEYPDIDGIVPIDLTNTERLPCPIQRSLDHLNDRRDHEEHQYSDWSGIDSEKKFNKKS